ncbi:MAG: hypothetical protein ACRBBK_08315 [Paracoccaceae bacterium]
MLSFTRAKLWILAMVGLTALAACGDTQLEQGLLGAGAGAGVAVVTGADPVAGAAVGAAGNLVYCQRYPSRCN